MGSWLARYLSRPSPSPSAAPPTPAERLLRCLRPGDVLLVEGNTRFSTAIKYLTQSTWSHAALFVGFEALQARQDVPGRETGTRIAARHCFVEADIVAGVRSVGIEEFTAYHTRICRPVALRAEDRQRLIALVLARIGDQYDLRNVWDQARYLLPTPPVPSRWRRRLLQLGSGDPTRAICSTLIASAFEAIRYPILPIIERRPSATKDSSPAYEQEILRVRHHSLYTPRDFDVSPYFAVVKPTLELGFDYTHLQWDGAEHGPAAKPDSSAVRSQ